MQIKYEKVKIVSEMWIPNLDNLPEGWTADDVIFERVYDDAESFLNSAQFIRTGEFKEEDDGWDD